MNKHPEQWAAMLQRPGSSWGFGVLLKDTSVVVLKEERALVIHSPTNNPCRTRDSNPQPLDYESNSLTIRPQLVQSSEGSFNSLFKAAVCNFYLFVALYVWKPGIAVSCGIIFRARGCDPVFRHGSSADESNVLRWMCSCQSLHRCGYLLSLT